jgi:hypothetical protein
MRGVFVATTTQKGRDGKLVAPPQKVGGGYSGGAAAFQVSSFKFQVSSFKFQVSSFGVRHEPLAGG